MTFSPIQTETCGGKDVSEIWRVYLDRWFGVEYLITGHRWCILSRFWKPSSYSSSPSVKYWFVSRTQTRPPFMDRLDFFDQYQYQPPDPCFLEFKEQYICSPNFRVDFFACPLSSVPKHIVFVQILSTRTWNVLFFVQCPFLPYFSCVLRTRYFLSVVWTRSKSQWFSLTYFTLLHWTVNQKSAFPVPTD